MNLNIQLLNQLIENTKINIPFLICFLGIFWVINIINAILNYKLNIFGLYPRTWHGFIGIFISPFLHGSFNHLFFNSIPLFVLGSMVLLYGYKTFYLISLIIIFLGGLAIWLFGRRGFHVGASGLIMGYFGYLLAQTYQQPNILTILLVVILLYYFGGLVIALIPTRSTESWEGHVFGFLAGITGSYLSPILLNNIQ